MMRYSRTRYRHDPKLPRHPWCTQKGRLCPFRIYVYNERVHPIRLFLLTHVLVALFASPVAATGAPPTSSAAERKDLVGAVKRLERKLGFRRTKNFHKESAETAVAYRCYYTGKLELPDS